MKIAVHNIHIFPTRHGGHDCFRLDGYFEDEFSTLKSCKTYVDPQHENYEQWHDVLRVIAENRGQIVELDNCKMKSLKDRIIDADSSPRVVAIYPKPLKKKAPPGGNQFKQLFPDDNS
jgi:hypothetical protein